LAYSGEKPASMIGVTELQNYDKKTNTTKVDKKHIEIIESVLKKLGMPYKKEIDYNENDIFVKTSKGYEKVRCNAQTVEFYVSKSKDNLDQLLNARKSGDDIQIGRALGYGKSSAKLGPNISMGDYMYRIVKDKEDGKEIPEELATIAFIPPGGNYRNKDVIKSAKKNAEALKKVAPEFYEKLVEQFSDHVNTAEIREHDGLISVAFKTGPSTNLVEYEVLHPTKKGVVHPKTYKSSVTKIK
jgi:hypothetical protein